MGEIVQDTGVGDKIISEQKTHETSLLAIILTTEHSESLNGTKLNPHRGRKKEKAPGFRITSERARRGVEGASWLWVVT